MSKSKASVKANTDYTLNPIELNTHEGEYIESQLNKVRKRYEITINDFNKKKEKRNNLLDKLNKYEEDNSRFNVLLIKPDKGRLELQELSSFISRIESIHNELYLLNRQIRETDRLIKATYSTEVLEAIQLGETEGANR